MNSSKKVNVVQQVDLREKNRRAMEVCLRRPLFPSSTRNILYQVWKSILQRVHCLTRLLFLITITKCSTEINHHSNVCCQHFFCLLLKHAFDNLFRMKIHTETCSHSIIPSKWMIWSRMYPLYCIPGWEDWCSLRFVPRFVVLSARQTNKQTNSLYVISRKQEKPFPSHFSYPFCFLKMRENESFQLWWMETGREFSIIISSLSCLLWWWEAF